MYVLILSFITAFVITFMAVPAIITVAVTRKLFDLPNDRSSHQAPTPSLGGIAMFGGAIVGIILWTPPNFFSQLQYTLAAIILLFLVGSRDDLVPISPIKKFIIQLLAAVILVYKAQVSLDNWWGILGVHQIDEPLAFIFSILTIVGIINAYNLIDGINGLAASMALMASLLFGGWFFLAGYVEWSVVAMALAGSIVAFLHYNVTPAKIFMGDTGSMLIGALCAVMAIEFIHLNMEIGPSSRWYMSGAPVVAMSILIFPVYDTLRVFYLRMKMGKSPFHADKNHLHHLLLQGGKTHMQATAILVGANLLMVALALGLQPWGLNWSLLLLAAAALVLNFILTGWLAQQKKRAARK